MTCAAPAHRFARCLLIALVGMAAAGQAVGSHAADGNTTANHNALARARARGKLVVGVAHVVPAYRAGAKFRTPEAIDTILADDLAKRLQLPLANEQIDAGAAMALGRDADLALAGLAALPPQALPPALTSVATGYQAGAMAIMRSDTNIKRWEDLKGRTVCMAAGGRAAGSIGKRFGAIEKVFAAPADALLSLRTGKCDAAVHDSALLEQLLKLPEWKKFSARLPVIDRRELVFVVPKNDAATASFLQKTAAQWRVSGYLADQTTRMARAIAFEVYLDQDVPDCH